MPYIRIKRLSGEIDTIHYAARAVTPGNYLTQRIYWRNDPDARPGKPTTLGYTSQHPKQWRAVGIGMTPEEAEQNAQLTLWAHPEQIDAVKALYGWYRKRRDERAA